MKMEGIVREVRHYLSRDKAYTAIEIDFEDPRGNLTIFEGDGMKFTVGDKVYIEVSF